jgi:hypothetical protein
VAQVELKTMTGTRARTMASRRAIPFTTFAR